MAVTSERHVKVLEELAKEHLPNYEVEKARDSNGVLGTPQPSSVPEPNA